MNLYQRDYTSPKNDADRSALKAYDEFHSRRGPKSSSSAPENSHPDTDVRRFLWHFNSLFPNNFLYHREDKEIDMKAEAQCLRNLLDTGVSETALQAYIKRNKKWFIPGSVFREYNFGHHDAYLFPEVSLGSQYRVDYVLLGKNSDGYSLVLIELEAPNEEFMLRATNAESQAVRKGITQIRDWKRWIDNNRGYLIRSLGLREKGIDIPSFRLHYCLVVSRRDRMDQTARDLRSQMMYEGSNLKIVSYDRLVDNVRARCGAY